MKQKSVPSLFDIIPETGYIDSFCHPGLRKSVSLAEKLSPQKGEEILHLGCGSGKTSLELIQKGVDLVAIDIDEKKVVEARKKGIRALLGNAENLDYKQRFDAVYLDNPYYPIYDCHRAMDRIYRALRPGGRLIAQPAIEGNLSVLTDALKDLLAEYPQWRNKVLPWEYPSKDECLDALKSAGFHSVESSVIYRPVEIPHENKWFASRIEEIAAHLNGEEKRYLEALLHKYLQRAVVASGEGPVVDYVQLRIAAAA